jgi:hypothetical protein
MLRWQTVRSAAARHSALVSSRPALASSAAMRALLPTAAAAAAAVALATEGSGCGSVEQAKGPVKLDQANSSTAVAGTACTNPDHFIGETSWFRAFRLADYDVGGKFHVDTVAFAVSEREIGAGLTKFPIDLSLFDYTGEVSDTLDLTKLTLLKSSSVDIVATTPTTMVVEYEQPMPADVTAPVLVFKIHVQNFQPQMHKFYLGISRSGETHPGYVSCGSNAPKTPTGLGHPDDVLLMSVSGQAL